ncbi:molybdate transporter [Vibrio galatheae]|uniref:Molybdate transporter n=1 Tax=Vibrio galatheae TaxID=579748 RepID=A0A0F4NKY8_9VIBR|nr:molybdate ABC transporter substrate-binding protein [Vibrio galatheae]KJY83855.1 molybdate transporter [Vibrio galatheae]
MTNLNCYLFSLLMCASFSTHAEKLRVYAASSMTNVVNELVTQFEANQPVAVSKVYGGSASLARQIAQGAPADIYISANQQWMEYLQGQGVVGSDAVTNLASNRLVVIAPEGEKVPFELSDSESWLAELGEFRLAIGQPNAVPAGMYAKEALVNLGVWQMLESRLAPTNNVRIALTLVERSETPLGIVYQTDAMQSQESQIVAVLPAKLHTRIVYPMAVLNEKPQTKAFAEFLSSRQAQNVLLSYGFSLAEEIR